MRHRPTQTLVSIELTEGNNLFSSLALIGGLLTAHTGFAADVGPMNCYAKLIYASSSPKSQTANFVKNSDQSGAGLTDYEAVIDNVTFDVWVDQNGLMTGMVHVNKDSHPIRTDAAGSLLTQGSSEVSLSSASSTETIYCGN